jgi:nicotinamidase/pyrazinamidase
MASEPASMLIVIDVQNDFCAGGALEVPDGDAVVPLINRLQVHFSDFVLTQDWHPVGHHSFASSHAGKSPYDLFAMDYGEQVLWPDHCVQGTPGAEFHPDLQTTGASLVVRKGFRIGIDSYSAFYENDHVTHTGLTGYLRSRGVRHLYLAGLATDFCVAYTALDARKEAFEVTVLEDACRAIDLDGSQLSAWEQMHRAGVMRGSTASL